MTYLKISHHKIKIQLWQFYKLCPLSSLMRHRLKAEVATVPLSYANKYSTLSNNLATTSFSLNCYTAKQHKQTKILI